MSKTFSEKSKHILSAELKDMSGRLLCAGYIAKTKAKSLWEDGEISWADFHVLLDESNKVIAEAYRLQKKERTYEL